MRSHKGRSIVVVGTSAGGLEALDQLVGQLPTDLPASLFLVQHMAAHNSGEPLLRRLSRHQAFQPKRSMPDISVSCNAVTCVPSAGIWRYEDMHNEMESRRADAESAREQHELARQETERARVTAEESRMSAEDGRRAAATEIRATIAALTTLVERMEAVEALRRQATKDAP